jgi:hypothetical protein
MVLTTLEFMHTFQLNATTLHLMKISLAILELLYVNQPTDRRSETL